MTKHERVIVSAYTGYLMCDFNEVHQYVEEKLGRPIWTHELAEPSVQRELHDAAREDFLKLCNTEDDGQMRIGF